ncbi:MAG: hypothetical protein H0U44_08465 [Flavisolibacter sp.]|nr:hypothetical protein [Flavisolibacter sp.]
MQFFLGICGFLFLLIMTYFHDQPPLFDEVFFVPNIYLFEKQGLTKEFLINLQNQAPGPLYEFVHAFFKPLTQLQTPGIRLVNVFLFGLVILITARIFTIIKEMSFFHALILALTLVAVPMVWQVAGLALTEMPAMFFSVFSILLLLQAIKHEDKALISSLLACAAGICLGMAILGRSPFLILVVSSGIFLLYKFSSLNRWRTILIYSLVALAVTVPVFMIWGGLVPPQQAFVGKGISIWHGLLAFAYAGMMALLIAPGWFFINRKIALLLFITFLMLVVINVFFAHYEYKPFYKAVEMVLPGNMIQYYPFMISPLLATLSLYFLGNSLVHLYNRRNEPVFVFLLVTGMVLLASNLKVTHLFSTRYVGQASPFFVLAFLGYDQWNYGRLIRVALGMAIGFVSLKTYIEFG